MQHLLYKGLGIALLAAIFVAVTLYSVRSERPRPLVETAPITVIQGERVGPIARQTNTAVVALDAAMPKNMQSIVKQHLQIREQQRDERWAGEVEARLRRYLQGAAGGFDVKRIECRTDACEIIGGVPVASADLRDRAVALMMDGTVQGRLVAAGMVPAGEINIDADEDGNLEVTFYASRS